MPTKKTPIPAMLRMQTENFAASPGRIAPVETTVSRPGLDVRITMKTELGGKAELHLSATATRLLIAQLNDAVHA